MWKTCSFFAQHPFVYQNESFVILCGNSASGRASRDNKGNTTVEGRLKHESDDGSYSVDGGGRLSRDSDGNVNGEVSVSVERKW